MRGEEYTRKDKKQHFVSRVEESRKEPSALGGENSSDCPQGPSESLTNDEKPERVENIRRYSQAGFGRDAHKGKGRVAVPFSDHSARSSGRSGSKRREGNEGRQRRRMSGSRVLKKHVPT